MQRERKLIGGAVFWMFMAFGCDDALNAPSDFVSPASSQPALSPPLDASASESQGNPDDSNSCLTRNPGESSARAAEALNSGSRASAGPESQDLQPSGRRSSPAFQHLSPPPASFSHNITNGTTTVTANFELHSIRGPNFAVFDYDATGTLVPYTAVASRTYLGTVTGYPGAIAAALVRQDDTVLTRVYFEDGTEWFSPTGGTSSVRTAAVRPDYSTYLTGAGGAGSNIWAADVGVDVPFAEMTAAGGTIDDAVDMVEYAVLSTNMLYLRDASIVHELSRVVVRTSTATDPYASITTTSAALSTVETQWNSVLPSWPHDFRLVASTAWGGGLGYVPGMSSSNGSEANGDFSIVWRHEVGHNWSVNHYEGGAPEGATIMSGNSLSRMSGPEEAQCLQRRTAIAANLTNLGPYAFPLPPHASLDTATYPFDATSSVTLDVLANDHDGNGEALTLLSFDATSTKGGSIVRSVGTGPGGRDQLVYSPNPSAVGGIDNVKYRIQDASGYEAVGNVVLQPIYSDNLLRHFALDGNALDSSPYAYHGALSGTPTFGTGTLGGAATFDGVNQAISSKPLNINTTSVTIAGWVKRNGTQSQWAGLWFTRGSPVEFGLGFGTGHELRYHPNYNWNSGLVVPDNVWTFVALVREPSKATIYMDSGSGLQSAVDSTTQTAMPLVVDTWLGQDPTGGRFFKGQLDDFRVYERSLTSTELTSLKNGTSANPLPAMGDANGSSAPLFWTSPPAATSHQLFVGSSYAAVRDATTASPEYRGALTVTSWAPTSAPSGATYWRVDEVGSGFTNKGAVWAYETVASASLVSRWHLDETSGSTVIDDVGGRNGTIVNSPLLGQPGATGSTNTSITFDGVDDRIDVATSPALSASALSVALWVKASGGAGTNRSPLAKGGFSAGYRFYAASSNRWTLAVGNGSGQSSVGGVVPVVTGQWTHLVGTMDSTSSRLYVDGALTGAISYNYAPHLTEPLRIGDGAGSYFPGSIDEVRYYSRVLSAAEVYDDYTGGSSNHSPAWSSDPLTKPAGASGTAYTGQTLAVSAADPDAGDTLTFSKLSGSSWLTVASNGALSGTPTGSDVGAHSFVVRATDASGAIADTTLQITVNDGGGLPTGYSGSDIGSVGLSGSSTYTAASQTYTVSGAGAGITGTADAFRFVASSLTGDGEIRARVTSQTNTGSGARAGVMLRDTTAANSRHALLALTPSNFSLVSRTTSGGSTTTTSVGAPNTAPNNWVRLTRSGTLVTASTSANGTSWTQVGTVTVTMGTTIQVGLAVTSGTTGALSTATFDNVTITPLPSPWLSADIGSTGLQGAAEYFGGVYALRGAGSFGGRNDAFRFLYQTLSADGSIVVRVPSFQNTSSARIGVMIRDTLATNAKQAFLGVDGGGTYQWVRRTSTNANNSSSTSGTGTAPNVWVRLTRTGNSISADKSADGTSWTNVGSVSITMASSCFIGIAVASGSTSTLNATTFDNVTVVP